MRHASLNGLSNLLFEVSLLITNPIAVAKADSASPRCFCLCIREASRRVINSVKATFASGLRAGACSRSQLLGTEYSSRILSFRSFGNPFANTSCQRLAISLWIAGPSDVSAFGGSPSNSKISSSSSGSSEHCTSFGEPGDSGVGETAGAASSGDGGGVAPRLMTTLGDKTVGGISHRSRGVDSRRGDTCCTDSCRTRDEARLLDDAAECIDCRTRDEDTLRDNEVCLDGDETEFSSPSEDE